jgi:hypothetical protein
MPVVTGGPRSRLTNVANPTPVPERVVVSVEAYRPRRFVQ